MRETQSIPIFPRIGNRLVAVNPALVRAVEATSGGSKIVFDQAHEILVDASLYEVIKTLWGPPISDLTDVRELTVQSA